MISEILDILANLSNLPNNENKPANSEKNIGIFICYFISAICLIFIIPEFKAGSYYTGLDKGADAIFEVLKGKYKGSRKESSNPLPFILIVIFIIILLVLASRGNKGGGNFRGGGGLDLGDIIILSSLGRSGGGFGGGGSFGGGSSGGFGGGFGGGGFSGGGAGGSW